LFGTNLGTTESVVACMQTLYPHNEGGSSSLNEGHVSFTLSSFSLNISQDFDQPHDELVDSGQQLEQQQPHQNPCCIRKPRHYGTGFHFGDQLCILLLFLETSVLTIYC